MQRRLFRLSAAQLLDPLPPELARRFHPQARLRRNLVEVLERRRQLRKDGHRITEVHSTVVVALERVDEALSYAVAL